MHEAAEGAPVVVEATLFAKSLSNGSNRRLWSIKPLAFPDHLLPSFASLWCVGREDLPKKRPIRAFSPFRRLKITVITLKFQSLIVNSCWFYIKKLNLPPQILICINFLTLFVRQPWDDNTGLLVEKATSLLPSSPRVFCPLLSSSPSSRFLREFFGNSSGWRLLLLPDRLYGSSDISSDA